MRVICQTVGNNYWPYLCLKRGLIKTKASSFLLFLFFSLVCWSVLNKTSNILDGQTGPGGASPHAGREERPPYLSGRGVSAPTGKKRWVPPSSIKKDPDNYDERNDIVFRRVRGILNKLAPEKFDKLSLELLNVGIDSQVILKGIILLIFEKALDEPKYSSMYAQLCHRLCEDAPNFEPQNSNITTFRRLLLNKCQDEFENRSKATEVYDRKDAPLDDEEMEQYHIAKRKMLGNIKFIGELGKLEMLHETILHTCIKQLLEKKKNLPLRDMAEDLECLCQIMRTVGKRLDTSKAKTWMNQYFERVSYLADRNEMPSRIRFMLQDVMELRANRWNPRRASSEIGPRTITQIRQDAAEEIGVFYPPPSQSRMMGNSRSTMNGNYIPQMKGGNFGDIFNMPPAAIMGSIGTGPGVITMDNFPSGYNPGMGKQRTNQQGQNFGNFTKRQDNGSPRNMRRNQNQSTGRQSPQNQQNQNTQQGQRLEKNVPPRFQKLGHQSQTSPGSNGPMGGDGQQSGGGRSEEISLRPAKTFMSLKPSSPNMLPKSAQSSPASPQKMEPGPPKPKPLLNKQPQITIKQASQEKPKPVKKPPPPKEELDRIMTSMLSDYFDGGSVTNAVNIYREINVPARFSSDVLAQTMSMTVNKADTDRDAAMKLISALKMENLINSEQYLDGFQSVLDRIADLETEVPRIKSFIAQFAAHAVGENIISLSQLAQPLENGTHYPLFLLCLQQMHKLKGKDWLVSIFNDSKLNLQRMLPEYDQRKEKMIEILEERGLSFMFPLLRVQSELWRQMMAEPNAHVIFKWIKDKVDPSLHHDTAFINILTTSILRHATQSTTLQNGVDPTATVDKTLQEREREALEKMKVLLQMFLHEHTDLQMSALYAAQVFSHSHKFPKGMLLRLFRHFYDMEIVEEETFLKWKEEVNDEYPGKGKALFQVNQWLTWLEQAEEESEED
ncbi:hypothetical protein ScPMuIL_016302 [Solemya velum]